MRSGTPSPYSRRVRLETWFYYNKWLLFSGIAVLILFIPVIKNLFHIGEIVPDYQLACVTAAALPEDVTEALSEALAARGRDLNGDGRVTVSVVQYPTGAGDEDTRLGYLYASTVTIQADITRNDSHFFLVEDPARFQIGYQILADDTGALPPDDDYSSEGRCVRWEDLQIAPDEPWSEAVSGLYLGQRGYYREEEVPHLAAFHELWAALTGGIDR